MRRHLYILPLLLVSLLALRTSFQRHAVRGEFNWRTTLWADQAGYYAYNPAWFIYGAQSSQWPDSINQKLGCDLVRPGSETIYDKYPCGTALLQAPFFLAVHAATGGDGISGIYQRVPDLAAAFYLFWGLFFLYHFLLRFFRWPAVLLTLCVWVAGTPLFYYATEHSGMSHVYSFFLFALLLWVWSRMCAGEGKWMVNAVVFAIVAALIVLVRPTGVLIFAALPLLDRQFTGSYFTTVRRLMQPGTGAVVSAVAGLVFLPQLIWWKITTGSFLTWSYGDEGFDYLFSPKIAQVLFAPENGLFSFSPVLLLIFPGLVLLWKRSVPLAVAAGGLFVAVTYYCSAWHDPRFGCSFGARNFTEYLTVFSLPVGLLLSEVLKMRRILLPGLALLFLLLAVTMNLRFFTYYNICFAGEHTWDWNEYGRVLFTRSVTTVNDFEKDCGECVEAQHAFSGKKVFVMDSVNIYSPAFKHPVTTENGYRVRRARVSYALRSEVEARRLQVVCVVLDSAGSIMKAGYEWARVKNFEPGEWGTGTCECWIEGGTPGAAGVKIFIMNGKKEVAEVDDFGVELW